jgi:hypothetical protein
MANYGIPTTLDTVALNTSLADYARTLTDNAYNDPVLWRMLNTSENKKIKDGGLSLTETLVKEKQSAGGFYLGADVLNNTQPNTLDTVEYLWQNAYEPITITRDEERQNSGAIHKILDLVATKTELSRKAIVDRLEQALSTPVSEANNLIDLETLVNTGTLGNIAGATSTWWQATVTASGAFAMQGLTDMSTATLTVASSATVDSPTVYITTKTIWGKFWNTLLPLERLSNADMTGNRGVKNLTFMGTPVVYGNYIKSGLLFGLNMNYVRLQVDSATDLITTDFISPVNQTVKVAYYLWRGNMTTGNRRRNFKLTSVS